MFISDFLQLHSTTKRLIITRFIRSLGQGILVVDFVLYLHALNWSSVAIGLLLSINGLFGGILTLLIGLISDKLGRKSFLLLYEFILLLCCIVAFFSTNHLLLATAAILGGFGRGGNGSSGPFSPAEQAWLSETITPNQRGRIYSLNATMGFFGMGLGALMATLPAWWANWLSGATAYRPLFIILGLATIINLLLLASIKETYHPQQHLDTKNNQKHQHQEEVSTSKQENQILVKLVLLNIFNGAAIGLIGPLISYWFALRFHIGPAHIAPVIAATFFSTALSSLVTGRLSERFGLVQSVVWTRSLGLILMLLLPLMPNYWTCSVVYLLRSTLNRGSAGTRQALVIGLVRNHRRGLASSLNAVSMQIPRAFGPILGGYLLGLHQLTLPFYVAAFLQGAYLLLYKRTFQSYKTQD